MGGVDGENRARGSEKKRSRTRGGVRGKLRRRAERETRANQGPESPSREAPREWPMIGQGERHHASWWLRDVVESRCKWTSAWLPAGSGSSFPDKTSQGGQVEPHIGQGDQGSATGLTIDGQALQAPAFEHRVAIFGSIAGTVVETLPGRRTDRNVAHQANGAIGKGFTHVDNLAMRAVSGLIGTCFWRASHQFQVHQWRRSLEARLAAEPLVSVPVGIESIGGQSIAERTDRTPLVIVAPDRPLIFAPVAGVSARIDNPLGTQLEGSV